MRMALLVYCVVVALRRSGKLAKVFGGLSHICSVSGLWRIKQAKTPASSVHHETRRPLILMSLDTLQSGRAVGSDFLVDAIQRLGRQPQISDTVVASIAINVINLIWWPDPICMQPHKSVGKVHAIFNRDRDVSIFAQSPGHLPYRSVSAW